MKKLIKFAKSCVDAEFIDTIGIGINGTGERPDHVYIDLCHMRMPSWGIYTDHPAEVFEAIIKELADPFTLVVDIDCIKDCCNSKNGVDVKRTVAEMIG